MKSIIFLTALFMSLNLTAQVGIGTTSPNAALDIRSSNQAAPTNTDGILIPKIDNFPASNPGANQDGMLVYVTGDGTPTKGYYYWDNSNTNWENTIGSGGGGAASIDELSDGKSDDSSVFLGKFAGLNDDVSTNRNTGIGVLSLRSNTSGSDNSAVGFSSLNSVNTGRLNTAQGSYSANNITTGLGNTAMGYVSLQSNTTGSSNTAIGLAAGYSATGSSNVFIGSNAGYNETGSNKLYIENSNTTTPLIYGNFSSNELGINWDSSTALPNTLSVNGTASKSTSGSWLANSDRRLKKDIKTISPADALLKIMQLRGVTYQWNDTQTGIERPTEVQYGFVAQEIMEIFPEKVTQDGQGFYQTAYGDYDALFVQAIKQLQYEIQEKDQIILQLKKQLSQDLSSLQQQINEMKTIIDLNEVGQGITKN